MGRNCPQPNYCWASRVSSVWGCRATFPEGLLGGCPSASPLEWVAALVPSRPLGGWFLYWVFLTGDYSCAVKTPHDLKTTAPALGPPWDSDIRAQQSPLTCSAGPRGAQRLPSARPARAWAGRAAGVRVLAPAVSLLTLGLLLFPSGWPDSVLGFGRPGVTLLTRYPRACH